MKKRSLSWVYLAGVVLLAATIAIPAWLLNRPKASAEPPILANTLDVVCTGRVDAAGQVRPLELTMPGRVEIVHVSEGAVVKTGEAIVTLDQHAYANAILDAKLGKQSANLEYQIAKAKADAQPAELEAIKKEIEAGDRKADASDVKLLQMRNQANLSDKVPVTKEDIAVFAAELASTRAKLEAERIRFKELEKFNTQWPVQAAELRVQAAAEAIKRAEKAQGDSVLRAPVDGTIIRLHPTVGSNLAPGNHLDPPIIFAPDGALIVRAEVEQGDLGRVMVGMRAIIKDDSRRDSPEWTGRVTKISEVISKKRNVLLDPGEFNDVRTSEVIVTLDPSPDRLRIGQRMVLRLSK